MDVCKIDEKRHVHYDIKICVSGAAELNFLDPSAHQIAEDLGREIVKQGAAVTTGATTGFPMWAAKGAKEAGGLSIGLSPAKNEKEHVEGYKLPLDYMDLIVYTGFGYPGRDLLLTRSSDAIISGPGRVGTFHEFTIAYEDNKPIGILESDLWETDEIIKTILAKSHRESPNVIFDRDPVRLVSRVIEMVKAQKVNDSYCNPFGPIR
jgi:hypothetical protein